MTAANFPAVMEHVFREEGGYVDHPKDPGGATNMGITHITLAEHRRRPVSKADVKALTKAEATEIYYKRYWDVIRGDDLPDGIDLVMMDGSVNSGVGRGPKWVQAALRVAQDGKVGRKTIDAAWTANAADVINAACDARLAWLKTLDGWKTFGRGWSARIARVRKEALAMAAKTAAAPTAPYNPPPQPDIDHYEPAAPSPAPQTSAESTKRILPKAVLMAVAVIVVLVLAVTFGPRLFGG